MHRKHVSALLFSALPAALILGLALRDGGYEAATQQQTAIVLWYGLFLGLALGLLRFEPQSRIGLLVLGLLCLFALLTGLSALWSDSVDLTIVELDRVLLYVGVLALTLLVRRPSVRTRVLGGAATAMAIVVGLAALSRMLPGLFPDGNVQEFLPDAAARLRFPLGYWNGLATFAALSIPLLIHAGRTARHTAWRVAAWSWIPVTGVVIYLTFSRGALISGSVGVLLYMTLANAWRDSVVPLAVAGFGTGALVLVATQSPEMADGLTGVPAARHQGLVLLGVTVAVLLLSGPAHWWLDRRSATTRERGPALQSLRKLGVSLAIVCVTIVAVGAATGLADDVVASLKNPDIAYSTAPGAIHDRLASTSSHGRYQFWDVSLKAVRAHPLFGSGAGTWEFWWAKDGELPAFVRNAHSLEMDVLAELGIVGVLLILAFVLVPLAVGLRRWSVADTPSERATVAVLLSVVAVFALSSAIDWTWKLPAVAVVDLVAAGLLSGPSLSRRTGGEQVPIVLRSTLVTAMLVVLAWLAIGAELVPLVTQGKIDESRAAVRAGDYQRAISAAQSASALMPWLAAPKIQLGLAYAEAGDLGNGLEFANRGLARGRTDWRNWYAVWSIYRLRGDQASARVIISQALERNPNSPLLHDAAEQTG